MLNFMNKYRLPVLILAFLFFAFSSPALASDYGWSTYGYGLYSTAQPNSGGLPIGSSNPPIAPVGGFVATVNGTSLSFNAGSDVTKIAISLDGNFDKVSLENYQPGNQIDLCSKLEAQKCVDGAYTVYIRFYTASGVASDTISRNIVIKSGSLTVTASGTPSSVDAIIVSSNSIASSSVFIALEKSLMGIISASLSDRLSGRILLQVEEKGEAWYVNPINEAKYYLGRPADAFAIMRKLGLGISNKDYIAFNGYAPSRLAGRILLKVEDHGEAYYVNPLDLKMHYLGRPSDAFAIMRGLGLGISNANLRQIGIGEIK